MNREVVQRNFEALSEGLKQQRSDNSRQDAEIVRLKNDIANLQQQLSQMRSQLMGMMKIGATSR